MGIKLYLLNIYLRFTISLTLSGNITDIHLSTVIRARIKGDNWPKIYVANTCVLQPREVILRTSMPTKLLTQLRKHPALRAPEKRMANLRKLSHTVFIIMWTYIVVILVYGIQTKHLMEQVAISD